MGDNKKQILVTAWWVRSSQEVLDYFRSQVNGLSKVECQKRLKHYGKNILEEAAARSWWKRLFDQVNDYLIWILLVGASLSVFVGEWLDGVLIFAIVIFMAVLGYVQDWRAEQSIASLKKLEKSRVRVRRDGQEVSIESADLVPGDIMVLSSGDRVTADARLIESVNVSMDEASLTGESEPVSKDFSVLLHEKTELGDRTNMVYKGTLVTSGRLEAVVIATGMQTEIGKIADVLQQTKKERTPLEDQLERLGRFIGFVSLGVVLLILVLNVGWRREELGVALLEAVALAVAAVPEGLPAVVTICLAFGVQKMAQKQALVRHLKAVEALGSVSIACTDKTGTLTEGKMTVTKIAVLDKNGKWTSSCEFGQKWLRKISFNNNNNSSPTEKALKKWSEENDQPLLENKRLYEFEFTSLLKRMTTINESDKDQVWAYSKGAPEVILDHCDRILVGSKEFSLDNDKKRDVLKQVESMAALGLRVLSFGYRKLDKWVGQKRENVEKNLVLVGMIGISDPPKEEVKGAISLAKQAGIRAVMITGDNPITARAIADQIGLFADDSVKDKKVLTGSQLDDLLENEDFETIRSVQVFARVSPVHKSQLVDVFQEAGFYVAMLGDGVNDAPSIKKSHVGVSMGSGSDVTRSVADLVLLDNNYSTLITAVEEGRNILRRIRLFITYLLSTNLSEIGIFVVAVLANWPMPLTPVMLLILNVLSDAAPAISMAREPSDRRVMQDPPRDMSQSIITKPMWVNILVMSVVGMVITIVAFLIGYGDQENISRGQTMAFVTLSFSEVFRAFTVRSLYRPVWEIGFFTNKWLLPAVLFASVITISVVYLGGNALDTISLSKELLAQALFLAFLAPVVEECMKPLMRYYFLRRV